jgi:hypothetical protein
MKPKYGTNQRVYFKHRHGVLTGTITEIIIRIFESNNYSIDYKIKVDKFDSIVEDINEKSVFDGKDSLLENVKKLITELPELR